MNNNYLKNYLQNLVVILFVWKKQLKNIKKTKTSGNVFWLMCTLREETVSRQIDSLSWKHLYLGREYFIVIFQEYKTLWNGTWINNINNESKRIVKVDVEILFFRPLMVLLILCDNIFIFKENTCPLSSLILVIWFGRFIDLLHRDIW